MMMMTPDTLAAEVNSGGLAEEQATALVLDFLDEHMRLGWFISGSGLSMVSYEDHDETPPDPS